MFFNSKRSKYPKHVQYFTDSMSCSFVLDGFQCQVIICLTELLKNYAANEWPRTQDKYG